MISKTIECNIDQLIDFVREKLGFYFSLPKTDYTSEKAYFWQQVAALYIHGATFPDYIEYADLMLQVNTKCVKSWSIYLNDDDRTIYSIMEFETGVLALETTDFSDIN